MDLSYVLPIRTGAGDDLDQLTAYLEWLSRRVDLVVVDNSAPAEFGRNHRSWAPYCRHLPPDPDLTGKFGKVNNVVTGLRTAAHERVVVADDDVRYDQPGLERIAILLGEADAVRPQNYFDPLPWHARYDTARTLLNRAFGADFPGTLGVRRSTVLAAGGYDGDVLFENLELLRTVEAMGGRVVSPLDLYVRRVPPTTRHFVGQRVRQAYDELARPAVLAAELAIVPTVAIALMRRRAALAVLGTLPVVAAELGRRRAGGRNIFPATASLLAPVWLAERGVSVWLALLNRARGGQPYGGTVLTRAATPTRTLRRRLENLPVCPEDDPAAGVEVRYGD